MKEKRRSCYAAIHKYIGMQLFLFGFCFFLYFFLKGSAFECFQNEIYSVELERKNCLL